jgi:hypothetical protein
MLKDHTEFNSVDETQYEQQNKERLIRISYSKASQLGFALMPQPLTPLLVSYKELLMSNYQMKRFWAGVALTLLSIFIFLDPMSNRTANSIFGLVVGFPGVLLIYFSLRADRRKPGTKKEAIEALVDIYREHPQGFLTGSSSSEATVIRAIGNMLNSKGGMALMREVHEAFSSRCSVYGAPRNLEHMWDNIGDWRG